MFKVVTIDNKKIPMKSNGYTGRLYARFFSKDFLKSIFELEKIDKDNITSDELSTLDELAYVLAKTANPKIGTFEEWLSQFDSPFSVTMASEQFIALLFDSTKGMVKPKKKTLQNQRWFIWTQRKSEMLLFVFTERRIRNA